MAGRSEAGRRVKPAGGFELQAWYFMRISGLILVLLALGHLFITHILNNVENINYYFVANRWARPEDRGHLAALGPDDDQPGRLPRLQRAPPGPRRVRRSGPAGGWSSHTLIWIGDGRPAGHRVVRDPDVPAGRRSTSRSGKAERAAKLQALQPASVPGAVNAPR